MDASSVMVNKVQKCLQYSSYEISQKHQGAVSQRSTSSVRRGMQMSARVATAFRQTHWPMAAGAK
jgi:hypothetical protein